MKLTTAKVISNKEVMPEILLTWLEAPDIAPLAKSGQFVMVKCGTNNEMLLRRPLSIHQKDGERIATLFRVTGKGTDWLSERVTDETLNIIGPLGNGFDISSRSQNLLLIAGGMGIAPLVFLAQEAVSRNYNVTLLCGAASKNELYPKNMLPSQVRYIPATDDGLVGRQGFVTDLLPAYIDRTDQVFACGPVPMYRTLIEKKKELLKGKPAQLSLELRMACGHGVCYGCTVNTARGLKQVCKDGPVFDLEDILIEEVVC
jgi:dihydroorotate dehydrogenase electron transfer subunit